MPIETHDIKLDTQGNTDIIDLTPRLIDVLNLSELSRGLAGLFVIGSTAGITTVEFEPGLVNHDLKSCFERLAPEDGTYQHEATWHDDNGHSHVRASLVGPSLTVPFTDGQPILGTWQQIVLIDFDTRARQRRVVVQLVGE